MQKSTSLIVPILRLNETELYSKLICSYLGNVEYEGNDNWGDYLYLHMKNDLSKGLLNRIRAHTWYSTEYDPDMSSIMFVMEIPETEKNTIVKPFLEGKYSEMDRKYVHEFFDWWLPGGKRPLNYKILTKSADLRVYWENRIHKDIHIKAEVWPRPMKGDEIYGREEDDPIRLQLYELPRLPG